MFASNALGLSTDLMIPAPLEDLSLIDFDSAQAHGYLGHIVFDEEGLDVSDAQIQELCATIDSIVQRLNVITLHLLAPALSPDQLHTIEVVEEKLSCIAKHLSRPPRQSLATVAEEASAASESKAEHRTQAKHKPRRRHAAGPPSSADAKAEFKAQILRRIAGDVGSSGSAA